ncbi:hypothetical protein M885DRAFT_625289, partial [Pelagophyceae sp. CCMP2097]
TLLVRALLVHDTRRGARRRRRRQQLGLDLGLDQQLDEASRHPRLAGVAAVDDLEVRLQPRDDDAARGVHVAEHVLEVVVLFNHAAVLLVQEVGSEVGRAFRGPHRLQSRRGRLSQEEGLEVPDAPERAQHGVCRGFPRSVQIEIRSEVHRVAAALPRHPRVHCEVLQRLHLRVHREAGHGAGGDGGVPRGESRLRRRG